MSLYRACMIQAVIKQAMKNNIKIIPEYETMPSGRRLRVPKCKTNRLTFSFVSVSIKLLNDAK